jgi:probable phosphoglycerate mutase
VTSRHATTTLLVRHAHTDAIGVRLCGRTPGIHLSAKGSAEADWLGRGLAADSLAAIYASPLERAVETARAIAKHQGTGIELRDELSEIDFGDWTGKTFAELDQDPRWHTFNRCRATASIPGGETAIAVQARMLTVLRTLAAAHQGQRIAVVSHGDPLRYAVLHFAGVPLDRYDRIEIAPASVSAVVWGREGPRLQYVNDRRFADGPGGDAGTTHHTCRT